MTKGGILKLVSYQRLYFGRAFRLETDGIKEGEISKAYEDALSGYEDEAVLKGYMNALKRGKFERLPTIAAIIAAAGESPSREGGVYRCVKCDKPWYNGTEFERLSPKRRGQIRCPECNAVLDKPLFDGFISADEIPF